MLTPSFEAELRQKLSLKSNSYQSEVSYLAKQLRFFDIQNTGALDFSQFSRGMEKIGVIIERDTLQHLWDAFYDPEHTGSVDYKAWAHRVYSEEPVAPVTSSANAYSP